MNSLQKKLTREIEKQESKPMARARVEGYRQNETSRAALETARSKQRFAVQWRKDVIASGADSVRTIRVSSRRKTFKVSVFSKDGRDVYALAPAAPQFFKFDKTESAGQKCREDNAADYYRSFGLFSVRED